MGDSTSANASNVVAVSQQMIGLTFDLPPLTLGNPEDRLTLPVNNEEIASRISFTLPKLVLPTSTPSFDWLGKVSRNVPDKTTVIDLEAGVGRIEKESSSSLSLKVISLVKDNDPKKTSLEIGVQAMPVKD